MGGPFLKQLSVNCNSSVRSSTKGLDECETQKVEEHSIKHPERTFPREKRKNVT